MSHDLDIIISEYKGDIERIENLLKFLKMFRDFGGSNPVSAGDNNIWSEAISLHSEAKLRRTDLPVLTGSLLLYLVGRFEYCIRQIVECIADEVSANTYKYKDLPVSIQKTLKQKTLEIAQNPKKFGHDEVTSEALLENLVRNMKSSGQVLNIRSEVLSLTDANMRPGVLQDVLKTVGLTDFWRDMGKQLNVKIALEKSADQEASAEAQAKLNEIMEDRNQIAHPTSSTIFPDADQVLKVADFLKILATNTVDFGKLHLSAYKNNLLNQQSST